MKCSTAHARPCKCYTNCVGCQHQGLTIHWKLEKGSFCLWTAVGHRLLSSVPSSKGGFNPHGVIAKTWLSQASFLSFSGNMKGAKRKHRGYCFHWWFICTVPLQQFVLSWEGLCLGRMSTGCIHLASWEQYKSKMIDKLRTLLFLTVWKIYEQSASISNFIYHLFV